MPARPDILVRRARASAAALTSSPPALLSTSSSLPSSSSSSSIRWARLTRPFSGSRRSAADTSGGQTHYDILGVEPGASAAELKSRFYTLSRSTHPDLNRDDPHAQARFQAVNEAYSVLADPDARARYDRDVVAVRRRHQDDRGRGTGTGNGHTNGTYAGSRPASGLSKRRSAFRGPPPSYFRHGGSGAGGARPRGAVDAHDEVEFDAAWTLRTQMVEDERRDRRREAAAAAAIRSMEASGDFWARFVIVTVVVVGGVSVGTLIGGYWDQQQRVRGGLVRGDGTLRRTSSLSSSSPLPSPSPSLTKQRTTSATTSTTASTSTSTSTTTTQSPTAKESEQAE